MRILLFVGLFALVAMLTNAVADEHFVHTKGGKVLLDEISFSDTPYPFWGDYVIYNGSVLSLKDVQHILLVFDAFIGVIERDEKGSRSFVVTDKEIPDFLEQVRLLYPAPIRKSWESFILEEDPFSRGKRLVGSPVTNIPHPGFGNAFIQLNLEVHKLRLWERVYIPHSQKNMRDIANGGYRFTVKRILPRAIIVVSDKGFASYGTDETHDLPTHGTLPKFLELLFE